MNDPAREWLRRREEAYLSGELPQNDTSYSSQRVKEALKTEANVKCAYCESRFSAVYFGDVEHIVPKSVKPALRLSYENLLYSCAICNNEKRDYFSATEPLINPYVDNIGEHLGFFGPLIAPLGGSVRGRITAAILNLNRPALFEDRVAALSRVLPLIEEIFHARSAPLRSVLMSELHLALSDDAEFAATLRRYVAAHGL